VHHSLCNFVVEPMEVVGERPESVGRLWATRMLSIGCPHGPKGLGPVRRTRPQIHRPRMDHAAGDKFRGPCCSGPMGSDLHTEA